MKISNINLTQTRSVMSLLSVLLIVLSVCAISLKGFNWGQDFTGGIVADAQLNTNLSQSMITEHLEQEQLQGVQVFSVGSEGQWQIRYNIGETDLQASLDGALSSLDPSYNIFASSFIGPQVGLEMIEQGGLAILTCFVLIMLYLSYRFEWRLALGSIVALVHDVVLVLGLFALTQIEFNLTVLAALLAVMGYSLNDSIIISDRIREVFRSKPDGKTQTLLNQSIVSTFSRTLVTSGTTLVTVSALWLLGGPPLEGFAIALCLGIASGTWSSISIGTVLPKLVGLKAEHYQIAPLTEADALP
ncbi:protein-export membrane protein SecF [Vibrio breoganii]|uniref:protein translocase subunit SecF n=1 Tax=Vibrio breoganii TaxID=553239 RepID=UPI000C866E7C|nr:protein translocase subunit SecF [Vibrio breoganii]PMG01873.1 protein-export membrane protein SecF [Vibrio breoganii]